MKEYLHVQNHKGMNIYYLNKEGRDLIGSTHETKWNLQAEHHIMRNDMYIHYGCPADWTIEDKIHFDKQVIGPGGELVKKEFFIRPDAWFTLNGKYHLLEVDNTQNMVDNRKKIELYAAISPVILQQFAHKPTIVFYTLSTIRKNKLKEICKELKVECEILTKEDIQ